MSPTRIVLVQHDALIRQDLKEELERAGYLVVGDCGDGASALNLARELRPDLVISCIRMSVMDGLALAATLTSEHIAPVLLYTALHDDEVVARAGAAGVIGYVVKPWRQADMRPTIELALARYRAARDFAAQAAAMEERIATRAVVEAAQALLMERDHLDGDQALRRIARSAMNNRKSVRGAAEAILLADELAHSTDANHRTN